MSHIPDVDIGASYSYAAGEMSDQLNGLVKGNLNDGRSIPLGVLSDARELFYLTLKQIEHDKDIKNTPMPPLRAMTIECLVMDYLKK